MKKGFTLIELLAVIVILAIIALIATPIVLNIIKDSKDSSTLRSANFYLNAVEQVIARENDTTGVLKNTKCFIEENKILICQGYEKELKIEINGEVPDSGKIIIKENKIDEIELYYKDKLIIKNKDKELIYADEIYEDVKDSNPGIICGEGTKEDLTVETCYIKSIEDLVKLSTLVNGGTTFENKKVELVYNLDFNNKRSYASKKVNEKLVTGVGMSPIGSSSVKSFKGTFEGNNNNIRGLYARNLFGYINNAIVQNLTICDANVNESKAVLIAFNYGGTVQNINLRSTNLTSSKRAIGSLVGYNENGIIKNITANQISVTGGQYYETGGLIGENVGGSVQDIVLNDIKMNNETFAASGMIGYNKNGNIQNIKASNIQISAVQYSGGIIGNNNSGIVKDVTLDNIKIIGNGSYLGGLIGTNSGELIENITLRNIELQNNAYTGGLTGINGSGVIKKVEGNNIIVTAKGSCGGLVGRNHGIIYNIRLDNIDVSGTSSVGGVLGDSNGTASLVKLYNANVNGTGDYVGGMIGKNTGIFDNSIADVNVHGCYSTGIGTGYNNGIFKNIVVQGNIESTRNAIGGLVGSTGATSTGELSTVSGVFKSGSLIGTTPYRSVGLLKNTTLNTLVSSKVLVNGNIVVSDDPTSVNGKSLDDMGIASKTEYEALGFEFESTDENEAYWYFNENDELDLFIK